MFSPMALVVGGERGLGPVADARRFSVSRRSESGVDAPSPGARVPTVPRRWDSPRER